MKISRHEKAIRAELERVRGEIVKLRRTCETLHAGKVEMEAMEAMLERLLDAGAKSEGESDDQ